MNPDLVSCLIAFLRLDGSIVTDFGDASTSPKFWSNYSALQSSPEAPVMPYLVFVEPQEAKAYETADNNGVRSDVAQGTLICDLYAKTELEARQLGEEVASVLNDCDEDPSFPGTGLFYFRRASQAMPPLPSTGPDASPTIFRRQMQFKYMYEETLS